MRTFEVNQGSDYLVQQRDKSERGVMPVLWLALAVVVLTASIMWINQHVVAFYGLLLTCLLLALSIALKGRSIAFDVGISGEERTVKWLHRHLPFSWSVYQNWRLEDGKQSDLDVILVGERGVVVIEVKALAHNHRYDGKTWEVEGDLGWKQRRYHPLHQLTDATDRLTAYLKLHDIPVPVQSRLAWAGTGHLELKMKPFDRRVWFVTNNGDWLKRDTANWPILSAETVQQINNLLQSKHNANPI